MPLRIFALFSFILAAPFALAQPPGNTTPPPPRGAIRLPQALSYRVNVNCVLEYTTNISCSDLKDTFFSNFAAPQNKSIHLVRVDNNDPVDLRLKITDELLDGSTLRYHLIWVSSLPDSSGTLPDTPVKLNTSLDSLSTLKSLTLAASQGLMLFTNIESINYDVEGRWVVVYGKPDANSAGAPTNWMDRLSQSPWYFNGSISGSGSSSGVGAQNVTNTNLYGSAEIAYLKEKYKLVLSSSFNQFNESEPGTTEGSRISGGTNSTTTEAMGVYSLNKNWSVAVINYVIKSPASNIASNEIAEGGVEWTLVPFRTTETKELAFRIGPEFTSLNLVSPNELGHSAERCISAFAQIYFYWVTMQDRLSLSSSVGLSKTLTYAGYNNIAVTSKANYQLTRFLGFNISGTYGYSSRSLSFPRNPDYSNPITSSFLTGQAGRSLNYTFGATFTLGNSTKKQRDRRWSTN